MKSELTGIYQCDVYTGVKVWNYHGFTEVDTLNNVSHGLWNVLLHNERITCLTQPNIPPTYLRMVVGESNDCLIKLIIYRENIHSTGIQQELPTSLSTYPKYTSDECIKLIQLARQWPFDVVRLYISKVREHSFEGNFTMPQWHIW